jgi:hypothetical protein
LNDTRDNAGHLWNRRIAFIVFALSVGNAACAPHACYAEYHVPFEKIEQSMHLSRGSTATAELLSADDVSTTKPGVFVNVPERAFAGRQQHVD